MFKKLLLAVAFIAPACLSAQKVAYYSTQEIITVYPAYQTAVSELETLGEKYQTELDQMQQEIQTKYEKYSAEMNDSTPANIRARREQELQDLYQRYEQAQKDNSEAFQQEQNQKMQPIQSAIVEAVNSVVREGDFLIAIDRSTLQTAVAVNEALCTDITSQVKTKLGITQ